MLGMSNALIKIRKPQNSTTSIMTWAIIRAAKIEYTKLAFDVISNGPGVTP